MLHKWYPCNLFCQVPLLYSCSCWLATCSRRTGSTVNILWIIFLSLQTLLMIIFICKTTCFTASFCDFLKIMKINSKNFTSCNFHPSNDSCGSLIRKTAFLACTTAILILSLNKLLSSTIKSLDCVIVKTKRHKLCT